MSKRKDDGDGNNSNLGSSSKKDRKKGQKH